MRVASLQICQTVSPFKKTTASVTLCRNEKTHHDNDMIEPELKVKNTNSGQLFRPNWVSSAECTE